MRVERAYERDYKVEKHLGPSKVRFVPRVKLDLSQVRDLRGKTPRKGSIGTYIGSVMRAARINRQTTSAERTVQNRARSKIMKPYRKLSVGAMRVRGGR